jgi:large subunit ribosomal protein L6
MSRIGRLPVTIPSGVQVDIDGRQVTVQGPKGTLQHTVADPIDVVREDGVVKVTRPNDEGPVRALHGLSRTLIANMATARPWRSSASVTGCRPRAATWSSRSGLATQ